MKKISTQTFKHTLRDIHEHSEDRKFCFVLGAGASFKSGIPTGAHLAEKWFKEISKRYSEQEIEQWTKEVKLVKDDLAAHYGSIYRKRFESDKTSGYEFLIQAMKDAQPTFGHIVLAQILTKSAGHCVLTTNFDSLIETAIYQFTDKTPLVCGHESLSGYARPSTIHPLIVKIHRDLLLDPQSDVAEISQLAEGWKAPLDQIFSKHIPIVIGYGGNDGSLMNYFENMNQPSNFFWCELEDKTVSARVEQLIEDKKGSLAAIKGFDEIMFELLWVFDAIKPIKEELETITKRRIVNADKQEQSIKENNKQIGSKRSVTKSELSAYEYSRTAKNESDYEKRKTIYLKALEKYPETAWLLSEYVHFLKNAKKEYDDLDSLYQKLIKINPNYAINYGNYANYLKKIKHEYDDAEKNYLKALKIEPNSANIIGNYANFLKRIRKNYSKAEKYYLEALKLEPNKSNIIGNYATFLSSTKKDYKEAEKYFTKALKLNPKSVNKNGNYAQHLLITGRKEEATKHLNKAFKLNNGKNKILLIELWFYRYAHYYDEFPAAKTQIQQLLAEEIKSIGWNLEDNVSKAIEDGHPEPATLKALAKQITSEA